MTILEALHQLHVHTSVARMATWAESLPEAVRADDRFAWAFSKRLHEIKESSPHRKERHRV